MAKHADPADAADAILWAEDSRIRALALCAQQDVMLERLRDTGRPFDPDEVACWMGGAYELLARIARAAS